MKALSIGTVVLLSLSISSLASADAAKHVKGDKGKDLARALKFAGVAPKTVKTVRTFAAASISCSSTKEGKDSDLGDYVCTIDKITVRDGLAMLLENALAGAGVMGQDGMSQHKTNTSAVSCVVDSSKSGDERVDCSYVDGPH
jgi:hypothetical protein